MLGMFTFSYSLITDLLSCDFSCFWGEQLGSRFDGRGFLQKFKGKSIMFVGDSLSRNMWESLICMLYTSVGRTKYNETIVGGDLSIFTFQVYAHYMPNYGPNLVHDLEGNMSPCASKFCCQ